MQNKTTVIARRVETRQRRNPDEAISVTVVEIASPFGLDTPFATNAQDYSTSRARNDDSCIGVFAFKNFQI